MEQEAPLPDLAPLLEAAADFASYPGRQNDAAAKDFLDRFPLSVLFGVLQNVADVPGSEETIVSCLDRIFKTKYGASHLPQYMLAESPYSSEFLLKTSLLQLLTEMISNSTVDSVLRLRAVLVGGRLLSSPDAYMAIHTAGITSFLLAIDGRLEALKNQNTDETENALEALGQIGTSAQGAAMLLTISPVVARHVLDSAFSGHGRGVQLAALYALGSICGVDRREESVLLNNNAEESLKRLIYETAANNPKLTPSGLLLKVLQQEPEIRLAAYRAISGLVARPWCLVEVCSRQEIITMVTDPSIESTKNNMEARHNCCVAINKALSGSAMLTDASVAGIAEKLQEAVRRGPYLVTKRVDAQPIVVTAERF